MYKHIHWLSPAIMGDVFKINRTLPYNLRTHNEFSSRVPKTVKYGTETISFLDPKVWALAPGKLKECSCLETFQEMETRLSMPVIQNFTMLVFFKYAQMYSFNRSVGRSVGR